MARHIAVCTVLVVAIVTSIPAAVAAALVSTDPHPSTTNTASQTSGTVDPFPPVATPDPVVRWMIDQVKQDTVRRYVGDLSGEWDITIRGAPYRIQNRNTNGIAPIQNATYYVGDHLRALGLTVEEHRWGPSTAPSIIGEKTGATRPGDVYMVTAHLDDMPVSSIAPGADDNASGSVAVLVAADVLSQFAWNCTLRFALWTGEEQGLMGSDKYALRAKNNSENIAGVFNLDMIAWNKPGSTPEVDLHADSTRPRTIDLANQAASVIDAYDIGLVPEVRGDGMGSSDHASFWKYGYDAILGIEDYYPNEHDFDPYYHTAADKLSTLDLGFFTEYVKAAVAETAHMAGCLTTGALQGQVLTGYDRSPVANAEIKAKDGSGREYKLRSGADGQYSLAAPPETYSATVTAYGYDSAAVSGVAVTANSCSTQDFVLAASAPAAPGVSVKLDAGYILLTWPHLGPNTAYQVHRSAEPYFIPDASTLLQSIAAAHQPAVGETLAYRDGSGGPGDGSVNRFYQVLGVSASGASAASGRTGEVGFALARPIIE